MNDSMSPMRIYKYRALIWNLAQRELKVRHKKSLLGWLWSLINPAATLGVYTLVFGYFLLIPPPLAGNGHLKSFAMYLFAALTTWNYFNAILNGSMLAFQTSGGMLTKVYFPPEIPALANVVVATVQLLIEITIQVVILVILGNVGWSFLWVPLIMLQVMLFATGVGLVMSLWNIRYRDVAYLIGIALQLLFYATPIVYRIDNLSPRTQRILRLNPLTHFVGNMRKCLYFLQSPSVLSMVVLTLFSLGCAAGGWWIFARQAPAVIEEL